MGVSIGLIVSDDVGVSDMLQGKVRQPALGSRKGRKIEFTTGADYFRRTGRWHRVDRTIDFENDWYDEIITDVESGEVVRECHEPLSEHRGRGSAKGPRHSS